MGNTSCCCRDREEIKKFNTNMEKKIRMSTQNMDFRAMRTMQSIFIPKVADIDQEDEHFKIENYYDFSKVDDDKFFQAYIDRFDSLHPLRSVELADFVESLPMGTELVLKALVSRLLEIPELQSLSNKESSAYRMLTDIRYFLKEQRKEEILDNLFFDDPEFSDGDMNPLDEVESS